MYAKRKIVTDKDIPMAMVKGFHDEDKDEMSVTLAFNDGRAIVLSRNAGADNAGFVNVLVDIAEAVLDFAKYIKNLDE